MCKMLHIKPLIELNLICPLWVFTSWHALSSSWKSAYLSTLRRLFSRFDWTDLLHSVDSGRKVPFEQIKRGRCCSWLTAQAGTSYRSAQSAEAARKLSVWWTHAGGGLGKREESQRVGARGARCAWHVQHVLHLEDRSTVIFTEKWSCVRTVYNLVLTIL